MTQWVPGSDIYFTLSVGGYRSLAVEYPAPVLSFPGVPGKIGDFNLEDLGYPDPWDGRDDNDHPLEGFHNVWVSIYATNPDMLSDSFSFFKDVWAYVYQCGPDCLKTQWDGDVILYYNSANFEKEPASLGYGWSSEGSMRIIDQGTDVFWKSANGSKVRWIVDGGNYVPFRPGTYTPI